MTKHFNKKFVQENRRKLRKDMTYCERIIWTHLRKKQLGFRFLRQYSVDNYIIDFYCPGLKLAVEIDGDIHELPEQKEYDIKRQNHIEQYGITFVRITNDEFLGNPNKAFKKIEDQVDELSNSLPDS